MENETLTLTPEEARIIHDALEILAESRLVKGFENFKSLISAHAKILSLKSVADAVTAKNGVEK